MLGIVEDDSEGLVNNNIRRNGPNKSEVGAKEAKHSHAYHVRLAPASWIRGTCQISRVSTQECHTLHPRSCEIAILIIFSAFIPGVCDSASSISWTTFTMTHDPCVQGLRSCLFMSRREEAPTLPLRSLSTPQGLDSNTTPRSGTGFRYVEQRHRAAVAD